jgi:hypothetical protein
MANTIATEQTRATLVEMAQGTRLAASHDARPAMQQQQQIRQNDKKE